MKFSTQRLKPTRKLLKFGVQPVNSGNSIVHENCASIKGMKIDSRSDAENFCVYLTPTVTIYRQKIREYYECISEFEKSHVMRLDRSWLIIK